MLSVLKNRTYRHLLSAQIIALIGTGLATVALGLLAYDIAGGNAGAVLGTALAIKMVAYIGIAPIIGAYADRLPRRAFLIAMDIIRAGVALALPFVDQIWQVYVLIFALQSASAAFTPTFQATIPDVLPDEPDYTRALSLSRLAYDLENLLSPILAAALLTVISFHWLFAGTSIGFIFSALFVLSVTLPMSPAKPQIGSVYARTTRGIRAYLKTPRLKGLLAITFAAAAASSMVIVNTVVIIREMLGLGQREVALTLAAYGGGSMLAAFILPRLLDLMSDRKVMLFAATLLTIGLVVMVAAFASGFATWPVVLAGWIVLGIAYSMSVTPSGRLLKRSAGDSDRPAIFAAQFALSHAAWLLCSPLAGQIGAVYNQSAAFAVLAAVAASGTVAALILWPKADPVVVPHDHEDLPADHPHMRKEHKGGQKAAHAFVIDDLHPQWPRD